MHKLVSVVVFAMIFAVSGIALAADGAKIYTEKCASCHGAEGEGMKMMGPPIKGNKFVLDGGDEALTDVIINGRVGETKKYKDILIPMMPTKLNDDELKAVIAHMKGLAQ
jgi:mono/diheme cytochrome c family protein